MPSSSLVWSVGSLLLSSLLSPAAAAQYKLVDSFEGSNFFDHFDFTTGADPTHGYVQYVDQATAQSSGLIRVSANGSAYMGVDSQTTLDPSTAAGRSSVRIESKKSYSKGLFIADIQHMPDSACGIWPAFWTVGKSWPADGEIDIIEGINLNKQNEMVLHTNGECTINNSGMTGSVLSDNCQIEHSTTGCAVQGTDNSFGTGFNDIQGGVYAMEWTDKAIRMWFFPRSAIPQSITDGNPDPSAFGTPMANFEGSCDIGNEFQAQQLIIDTTFCGDWAGGVYGSSGCPMSNPSNAVESCVNYVAQNPTAYANAYWEINSIKIYQQDAAPAASSSPAVSSSAVPARTSSAVPSSDASVPTAQPSTTAGAPNASASASVPAVSSSAAATDDDDDDDDEADCDETGDETDLTTPTPAPTATAAGAAQETVTTVIVTSYVDICPTGFTTSTVTRTVTYCPADVTSGALPPGFTTRVTVCTACAATPTTVTLTLPTAQPSATPSPAAAPAVSTAAGASATLVTVPRAAASSSVAVVPAASSAPYPSSNGTSGSARSSVGFRPSATRVSGQASSTNSVVAPVFTGAASRLGAGLTGLAGAVAVALLV